MGGLSDHRCTTDWRDIDLLVQPLTNPEAKTSSGEYTLTDPHVKFFNLPGLFISFSQVPADNQQATRLAFKVEATASSVAVKRLSEGVSRRGGWLIGWNGVSLIHGPHLEAIDLHRLAVVSTRPWRANLQFTGRFGAGIYNNDGRVRFRLNGGVGLEKEFSLFAVRAEIEKVHFSKGPNLRSHWVPSVGLNLMLPLTWAAHLKPHKECK